TYRHQPLFRIHEAGMPSLAAAQQRDHDTGAALGHVLTVIFGRYPLTGAVPHGQGRAGTALAGPDLPAPPGMDRQKGQRIAVPVAETEGALGPLLLGQS